MSDTPIAALASIKQTGLWRTDALPPVLPSGYATISECGWGSYRQLKFAGVEALNPDTPKLWLCGGTGIFPPVGIKYGVAKSAVKEVIRLNGRPVGIIYEDAACEYAMLTGILPRRLTSTPSSQTMQVFEGIEQALDIAGMKFKNVIRTWLYMDRILDWYDDFNLARNRFFRERRIFDGLVPASTGIGSANISGSAIAACAIAVKPKATEAAKCYTAQIAPSPLQQSAHDYGSSFSRGIVYTTPGAKKLFVSGTASIYPNGLTAYVGDIDKQLELTLDVVEGILSAQGMTWQDATRGIMYLKHPEYYQCWKKHERKRGITIPVAVLHADVCRDDLLCEMELDAETSI